MLTSFIDYKHNYCVGEVAVATRRYTRGNTTPLPHGMLRCMHVKISNNNNNNNKTVTMNAIAIRTEQPRAAVTCLAGTLLEFHLGTRYLVDIGGLPEQI
jgi:hypothetical protein